VEDSYAVEMFFIIYYPVLIFAFGCSSQSVVTPERPADNSTFTPIEALNGFSASMSQIWMTGTMIIKPEIGEGEVIYNRSSDWNFNITSMLTTACPGGCFKFRIVSIVGTMIEIELSLENPTSLQVTMCESFMKTSMGKNFLIPPAIQTYSNRTA